MAERRMFAKTIIDSDAFLDMPLSAQALYFHLSMRADDEGFVSSPKKIQKMIGASDDDCKLLILKRFILTFESGIVVIKHWKIHNYIQSDRFKATTYIEEKAMLHLDSRNVYTENRDRLPNGCQTVATMYPICIQPVSKVDTQYSIGKDSIGKDSIEQERKKEIEKKNNKQQARTPAHEGKSHKEIMVEWGVPKPLQHELGLWLTSCYNKGHLVLNETFEDLLCKLYDKYGNDDKAMCEVVRNATESGYVRIVV